jgi:membrane protein implicated in regulation of membrane protease activity
MDFIMSHLTWFWLGLMVIFVVIEAVTFQLTTVWAALASLAMIFICKTEMAFKWQLLIFLIITILLIVFTRPFVMKKLKLGKNVTNVNSLIGQDVLVTKSVAKFEKGEGKTTNGVVWTITSIDGTDISEGSVCTIENVDGNTLSVKLKTLV